MGVLYEHWRPDLNECFYVGASWANPETRPYEMSDRNDDHFRIQEELAAKGLSPEVKVIDCSFLLDEELDELETLQIAYWKELIGDRLVNVAKGGRVGWGFAWSDEMKDKQSERMKYFYKTDNGEKFKDALREQRKEYSKTPEGIALLERMCLGLKTDQARSENSKRKKEYFKTESGKEHLNKMISTNKSDEGRDRRSKSRLAYYQTPEGLATREEKSKAVTAYFNTPRGLENRKLLSESATIRMNEYYSSEEGQKTREFLSKKNAGSGNPCASIKENLAQEILDFDGTVSEAAKHFGVTYNIASSIKKRRKWQHLVPSIELKSGGHQDGH